MSFLMEIWLPTFSTMRILNTTVGTVLKQFEKYVWSTNRARHFSVIKNYVCFGCRLKTKNYLETEKAENFLIILLEKAHLFKYSKWIKVFRAKQTVAKLNFLKLSWMQIRILIFRLSKVILLGELKSRTCNKANRRSTRTAPEIESLILSKWRILVLFSRPHIEYKTTTEHA